MIYTDITGSRLEKNNRKYLFQNNWKKNQTQKSNNFFYRIAKAWNLLPAQIVNSNKIGTFKIRFNSHLIPSPNLRCCAPQQWSFFPSLLLTKTLYHLFSSHLYLPVLILFPPASTPPFHPSLSHLASPFLTFILFPFTNLSLLLSLLIILSLDMHDLLTTQHITASISPYLHPYQTAPSLITHGSIASPTGLTLTLRQ